VTTKKEIHLGHWALWKIVVFALLAKYLFFTEQGASDIRWLNYVILAYLCSLEHLLIKISNTQK